MKNKNKSELKKVNRGSGFSIAVFPIALAIAIAVFIFVFGDPDNFMGGDPENAALPGNFFGIIYKGGYIVPILISLLLIVITFTFERFITISRAAGRKSVVLFVMKIKQLLNDKNIDDALVVCDKQKGSVANVTRSALNKYQQMAQDRELNKEQKVLAIQKEIEEATSLELPSLEQNLVVLSTIASIATLMGLLGTVLGMIRAFAALANAGAPDSVALAEGISEALINTAFGIGTSALAIIFYNFFTTKIDKLTYSIDEAGFSIVQSFNAKYK